MTDTKKKKADPEKLPIRLSGRAMSVLKREKGRRMVELETDASYADLVDEVFCAARAFERFPIDTPDFRGSEPTQNISIETDTSVIKDIEASSTTSESPQEQEQEAWRHLETIFRVAYQPIMEAITHNLKVFAEFALAREQAQAHNEPGTHVPQTESAADQLPGMDGISEGERKVKDLAGKLGGIKKGVHEVREDIGRRGKKDVGVAKRHRDKNA